MNFTEMKEMAKCLNTEAQWMVRNYLIGGAVLGLILGGGNYFFAGSNGMPSVLLMVCASAWLGWVAGRKRVVGLRLQAQASRCLAEMAANRQRRSETNEKEPEQEGLLHLPIACELTRQPTEQNQ